MTAADKTANFTTESYPKFEPEFYDWNWTVGVDGKRETVIHRDGNDTVRSINEGGTQHLEWVRKWCVGNKNVIIQYP